MKPYAKIAVVVGVLFFGHALQADNSNLQDVIIDKPYQNIIVDSPCKQLIVKATAKGCSIKINAPVKKDVFIAGDDCTIELLRDANFGTKTISWWQWVFGGHTNQASHFSIIGDRCTIKANSEQKKIDGKLTILGNKAQIHAPVAGSLHIEGDDCTVQTVGGSATIIGNHTNVCGAIGGSASIEGTDASVQKIGGSAKIIGNDCVIYGSIGGSPTVEGDRCKIHGSVGGSVTVLGKQCALYGHVGGLVKVLESGSVIDVR